MKQILLYLIMLTWLSACYPVETTNIYNKSFTEFSATSRPIYLSFRDNKNASFYFLLSRTSKDQGYRLYVRWHNPERGDMQFDGTNSSLKFFINESKILTLHPIKRPKVVSYNLDVKGQEEEGAFLLSPEEFRMISEAKRVTVQLTGRYIEVTGHFNRRNTLKAFKDFANNSH